jgi:phage internal scaffolding protein
MLKGMMLMEIRSRYNAGVREGWKSSVPSMTQQQFKDEADINYIVSMYDSSGVMPTFHGDGQPAQPVFGDFASLPDNAQEMYNRMIEAKSNFDNLPLEVRKRFNYDPAAFLEFVDNPENLDELVAMGLATKTVIKSDNHTENMVNNAADNVNS